MAALRETAKENLPKLRDQLAAHLPQSLAVHGVIDVGLRYDQLESQKIRVFTTGGESPRSLVVTTPMVGQGKSQSLSVFWNSEEEEDEAVAAALSTLPDFNWDKCLMFFACSEHLLKKMERMIQAGELGTGKLRSMFLSRAYVYTLTSEPKGESFSLTKEFEMRPVDANYAEHMLNYWEHKKAHTVDSYKQLLLALPGYAVFRTPSGEAHEDGTPTDDKNGGAPVAWTHLSKYNSIGNTFTLPEYRRRGLAKAVTLGLATHMIRLNGRASACIHEDNNASAEYHERLGFKRECAVGWHSYTYSEGNQSLP